MAVDKKRRILAAAKELLWRVGFEGMSPKRLLAESGAGQGSLYHHFSGKKAVALAALEEVEKDVAEDLALLADERVAPLEAVRRFLFTPRRGALGCRFGRLVNESSFDDFTLRAPIERYFTRVEEGLAARLRQAQESGALDPALDAERLAVAVSALIQGGYVLSRARRSDAPLQEAVSAGWALLQRARPNRTGEAA